MARKSQYDVALEKFGQELTRLAELAHQTYCRNPEWLYLHGRKHNGIWQEFTVCPDEPDGWEVVACEYVPRHLPVDALREWFRNKLRREPQAIFSY